MSDTNDVVFVDKILSEDYLAAIHLSIPRAYWLVTDGKVLQYDEKTDSFKATLRDPDRMREAEMQIFAPCLLSDPPGTFARALRREVQHLVDDMTA